MASTIPTALRFKPSKMSDEVTTSDHLYNLTQSSNYISLKQRQDLLEAELDRKLTRLPCKDTVSALLFMRRHISREKTKQFDLGTLGRMRWGTVTKNHLEESEKYLNDVSGIISLDPETSSCDRLLDYITHKNVGQV
jgi:hypothetical protein